MRLHNGEVLTDKQLANAEQLNLSIEQYMRRKRNGKYLLATYITAAGLAAAGYYTSERWDDEPTNPVCDMHVDEGDTISALQRRLQEAGDDPRGEAMAVRAGDDGHLRNPDDDPGYFIGGSMALKPGDSLLINNIDPETCVEAEGRPILHDDKGDSGEQPDFLIESFERLEDTGIPNTEP